jgi:hypothetical protein
MSLIKEAIDAIKGVAEGIEHIQTIAKAIREGRDYVKQKDPEINKDLAAMCTEMRNTLTGIAAASAVLTHFRFTISGSAVDSEPRAFNNHLIAHKEMAEKARQSLHAMRGHCHVIEKHAERLRKRAGSLSPLRLLLLFGIDSAKRDMEIAESLKFIYDEEQQSYRVAEQLNEALHIALNEISKALGPSGSMLPVNVPVAAALLGEYADAFSRLESTSNYLAFDLQQSIETLQNH